MAARLLWSDVSFTGNSRNSLGDEALSDAINNIIATSPGERLFDPTFGCDLESLLFEPIDQTTASMILSMISSCLKNDPRFLMDFSMSSIEPDPDNNLYRVQLGIRIYGQETTGLYQFSLNRLAD